MASRNAHLLCACEDVGCLLTSIDQAAGVLYGDGGGGCARRALVLRLERGPGRLHPTSALSRRTVTVEGALPIAVAGHKPQLKASPRAYTPGPNNRSPEQYKPGHEEQRASPHSDGGRVAALVRHAALPKANAPVICRVPLDSRHLGARAGVLLDPLARAAAEVEALAAVVRSEAEGAGGRPRRARVLVGPAAVARLKRRRGRRLGAVDPPPLVVVLAQRRCGRLAVGAAAHRVERRDPVYSG
eukprot:scaffold5919_cov118-Isochrysis_galbana.AAC.1